jgi:hypothetical protein
LSLGDIVSSEVEIGSFVDNGVFFISLMASSIAVFKVGDSPVLEVVLSHITEYSLGGTHGVGIGGGASQCGFTPLEAVVERCVQAGTAAAPTSAFKTNQKFSRFLALRDVVCSLCAIQAQRIGISHHYLLEVTCSKDGRG